MSHTLGVRSETVFRELSPRRAAPRHLHARIMLAIIRSAARRLRPAALIGAALVSTTLTACAPEGTVAPAPVEASAPSQSLLGGLLGTVGSTVGNTVQTLSSVTGLLRLSPQPAAEVTARIGSQGGTLSLGNDITLTVPKGAVRGNTTFAIKRIPGLIVAYDFEPHGTTFDKPLIIEQSTNGTNFSPNANVRGAYFPNAGLLNQLLGRALVTEFRPATVSPDGKTIRFTVEHFSGYMVSMD